MLQGTFAAGRPLMRSLAQAKAVQMRGGYAMELPTQILAPQGGRRGKPLPEPVRQKMESALGADFADVRVHVGPEASSIGALAFAHGSDLYFAPGLYDPHTTHGQRLLGHELAHVVKQRQGRERNPFGAGVAVVQDPSLEAEAERLGMMAATHRQRLAAQERAATGCSACTTSQPRMAPGAPAVAAHVQAAIARTGGRAPAPAAGAGQAKRPGSAPAASSYKLIVGTYLHQSEGQRLPEDLAGHTFVAIQEPTGRNQAWGFSPANYSRFDPHRDLSRLTAGVPGQVHGDESALHKPGVRTRSYAISSEQAQAAMAKVAEYRSRHYGFSLSRRACSSFALDVARAAAVDPCPGSSIKKPRDLYRQL